MKIHTDFPGGNILLLANPEEGVYDLNSDLRDTTTDWFYWAFCVEGAQGKKCTFRFPENRVGYFGPAISHDLKTWKWLGSCDGESFTYTFGKDEDCVYFAHDLLYSIERFNRFIERKGINAETLCISLKGREVPYLHFGEGKKQILLAARHHACESTGSYVLEGVLDSLLDDPIPDTVVFCVPFVDMDGVTDGDQGKCRAPWDHNRDYKDNGIYPETAAIVEYAKKYGAHYAFDFHSPWHKNLQNDTAFIPHDTHKIDAQKRFGEILEKCITEESFPYRKADNYPPNTNWNHDSTTSFSSHLNLFKENRVAIIMETAYFGKPDSTPFSQENGVEFGKCCAEAIRRFVMSDTGCEATD